MIVSPSLLSCDFGNVQRDVEMLNRSNAEWIHIDVMDGVFVPNISFGFPILSAVRKHTNKVLDVHLMIQDADPYLADFKKAGADIITVHYEACTHLHRTIQAIKELGMNAGVALNPHTPVNLLTNIIHELDLVLIMSVNPGFGGQKFIENSVSKVKELHSMKQQMGLNFIIEVDGGVNSDNAPLLKEAGADSLVAGSFVFNSSSPEATIEQLSRV
jgi:ribulose-phosphate 3-epimerase